MSPDDFAKYIRSLREARGWSREELSSQISSRFGENVSGKTIHALEEGTPCSLRTIAAVMAALFDMTIEQVVSQIVTS